VCQWLSLFRMRDHPFAAALAAWSGLSPKRRYRAGLMSRRLFLGFRSPPGRMDPPIHHRFAHIQSVYWDRRTLGPHDGKQDNRSTGLVRSIGAISLEARERSCRRP